MNTHWWLRLGGYFGFFMLVGLTLTLTLLLTLSVLTEEGMRPAWAAEPARPRALPVYPGFTVDLVNEAVWGRVSAGDLVTVTRTTGGPAFGNALADGSGFFWTPLWHPTSGQPADVVGGDVIDVYVNGALNATLTPRAITGGIHVADDEVVGTIDGLGAGTSVTVTLGIWGGVPGNTTAFGTATTDADGTFTVTFGSIDLIPVYPAAVDYQQSGFTVRGYLFPDPPVFQISGYSTIAGFATPGQTVTATSYLTYPTDARATNTVQAPRPFGFYQVPLEVQAGDVVEVDLGGTVISATAAELRDFTVDATLDRVSGTIQPGTSILATVWQWHTDVLTYAQASDVQETNPVFTANFSTDIRPRDWIDVYASDANGNATQMLTGAPFINAVLDPTSESDCVWGRVDAPKQPITLSIQTTTGEARHREAMISDSDNGNLVGNPWAGCFLIRANGWPPAWMMNFAPGDVLTLETPSFAITMTVPDVAWTADTASDVIDGNAPSGEMEVALSQWWAGQYPINGSAIYTATGASPFSVSFPDFDVRDSTYVSTRYFDPATGFATEPAAEIHFFEVVLGKNGVSGRGAWANEVITATLYDSLGAERATTSADQDPGGSWFWYDFNSTPFNVGDWITLTGESGWTAGLQVPELMLNLNAATDKFSGTAPQSLVLVEHYWPDGSSAHLVPSDDFALDAAYFGEDITARSSAAVTYASLAGNRARRDAWAPFFRANLSGDWVDGQVTPNASVWITATDSLGNEKGTATTNADGNGWFKGVNLFGADPDLVPGDLISVSDSAGNLMSATLITVNGQLDEVTNLLSGTMEGGAFPGIGRVEFNKLNDGWWSWDFDVQGDGSYAFDIANAPDGQDVQPGDMAQVWYVDAQGNELGIDVYVPYLQVRVNKSHDWVNGQVQPPATVFVTVTRNSNIVGTGNSWGGPWWNTNPQDETGKNVDIQAGDIVFVGAGELSATIPIVEITATVDSAANTVSGQVLGVAYPAQVRAEIWKWNGDSRETWTDESGYFSVDFSPTDLLLGDMVAINYVTPEGHEVILVRRELGGQINLSDDVIQGNALPGTVVNVTALRGGNVIGTGSTTAEATEGWMWTTVYSGAQMMNLLPGDVFVLDAGARVLTVTTDPDFTADFDPASDTVFGTLAPNAWVNIDVWGKCGVQTQADGAGDYTFNTNSPDCGYLDMDDSTRGAVYYSDADYQQVQLQFGYPDLVAEIWGQGEAAPGGRYQYDLHYRNDANTATNAVLTATLPAGVSYVSDTSGGSVSIAGQQIVFSLGTLLPNTEGRSDRTFQLFVQIDESLNVNDWVTTGVEITSDRPDSNPGNNTAQDSRQLVANTADVHAWKDPRTGDPAPGEQMIWQIGYRNDGGTGSGAVRLTDTLPISNTFVDWWADEPGWALVYSDGLTLAWERALIPSYQGNQLYLVTQLDPALNTNEQLWNTVEITSPTDTNSGNNSQSRDVWTKPPRWDVSIDANFNGGATTPGVEIVYGINYNNNGNSVAHDTRLTVTIPSGTTFTSAGHWTSNGWADWPYASHSGNVYVWDVGALIAGMWNNEEVRVRVNDDTLPGSTLTLTAEIGASDSDTNLFNNVSTLVDTVFPHGPNLHTVKWLKWQNGNQAEYDIRLDNRGDQPVSNIFLTDTFPISTTLNNWWMQWGKAWVTDTQNADNLVWWIQQLGGGETIGFGLQLNFDGGQIQRMLWYTNTLDLSPVPGDTNPDDNTFGMGSFGGGEVDRVEVNVDTDHGNGWGNALPNALLTVTTASGEYTTTSGDSDCGGCWNLNDIGPLYPGDTFTVTAGEGLMPIVAVVPAPFTAYADSITNQVWGQIDDLDHAVVNVNLNGYFGLDVATDENGNYVAAFGDVPRGGNGDVRYETEINHARVDFHHRFSSPDLIFTVSDDDWLEVSYAPGHRVWFTVTNSTGEVKATMVASTTVVPWWNGGTGYSTNIDSGLWSPSQPDIQPGDWMHGAIDTGYTTTVRVGTITGDLDVDNDRVTGTITATWFSELLNVTCWVDGEKGNWPSFTVDPAGGGFTCDLAPFDVQPQHSVSVQYQEPDGDYVRHTFRLSLPHVRIGMWADGDPGEGGNYLVHIQYWNDGDAPAGNTVITYTSSDNYLGDTSGFAHTGTGAGPVVWDLGTLPPHSYGQFDVFLSVSRSAGQFVTVTTQIATTTPYDQGDPGEKSSDQSWEIKANETYLNVGKGAWTGDPVAGGDFIYSVNTCNKGSTASSELTLTDTLPLSTTLQYWWPQNPGWTEVYSDAHTLVVSRPAIPGYRCEEVYLRVTLDPAAWPGMQLTNAAIISASNDLEDGDNTTSRDDWVGQPRPNLWLNQQWGNGALTPGGLLHYRVDYGNSGNLPVGLYRITNTLPVSTTFVRAWWNDWQGEHPLIPTITTSTYVVWEFPGLDNGYSRHFDYELRVAANALSSTALIDTAGISPQPGEYLGDNVSVVAQILHAHGPNLRVTQWGWWNGDTPLQYQIQFENIGDETVNDVWLTDTVPDNGDWNGWWQYGWDWKRLLGQNLTTDVLIWHLSNLNPGDSGWVQYQVDVADPMGRPYWYTNTVAITLPPGDVDPSDNAAVDLQVRGEVWQVELHVGTDHADVWGNAMVISGETVTVTTAYTQLTTTTGNGCGSCWNIGNIGPVQPGDTITVEAGMGLMPVVFTMPSPFIAYSDSNADQVSGHIGVPRASLEVQGNWPSGYQPATADETDYFTASFFDVPLDGTGEIRYRATFNHALVVFHRDFRANTAPALDPIGDKTVDEGSLLTFTATATDADEPAATLAFSLDSGAPNGASINSATGVFSWTPTEQQGPGVYTVTVRVTDTGFPALSDFETFTITVNEVNLAPTANAGPDQSVFVNVAVMLDASNSTDPDGNPLTYLWTQTGGAPVTFSNAHAVSPTFKAPGTPSVLTFTLAVSDTLGLASLPDVVVVTVTDQPLAGLAAINNSPTILSQATTFTATKTAGTNVTYAWNFGDGGAPVVTTSVVAHTYAAVGGYHAIVTATNSANTLTATTTVTVFAPSLLAAFTYAPDPPHIPVNSAVRFTDTSVSTFAIAARLWQFGDGATSAAVSPVHTYTVTGLYTVTLIFTDTLGNSDSAVEAELVMVSAGQLAVDSGQSGTLLYVHSGMTSTLFIPAGAVTQPTTIVYNPLSVTGAPSGFQFAGHGFTLDAYFGDDYLPGFTFLQPVTLTQYYSEADVAEVDENSLTLRYWDTGAGQWLEAACGPYERHPDENWLRVPICHFSDFGLFGSTGVKLYLPLIMRP